MAGMMSRGLLVVAATGTLVGAATFAAAYEAVPVSQGGAVKGTVRFVGTPPEPETVLIGKDNNVCGEGNVLKGQVKPGKDGALSAVVVFLEKVERGKPWPERKTYTISQVHCSFEPFLQVVPKGASVTIVNNDPILHNIHPFEVIGRSRRTLFNLAQPKQGQTDVKTVDPGRSPIVELSCDAHNWMSGWLYVLDHPYFAVAGEDGAFSIDDIPPGSYKLTAWHPVLGSRSQSVQIAASSKAAVSFTFGGAN